MITFFLYLTTNGLAVTGELEALLLEGARRLFHDKATDLTLSGPPHVAISTKGKLASVGVYSGIEFAADISIPMGTWQVRYLVRESYLEDPTTASRSPRPSNRWLN
jgi:hypothetical protein